MDMLENDRSKMELNECATEVLNADDKKKYSANIKRILPYLALNEVCCHILCARGIFQRNIFCLQVFIGETLSARVSHLHLKLDDNDYFNKTKSSGLCVSTGTGSSSWLTSINRLSTENVKSLFEIIKSCGGEVSPNICPERVSDAYNKGLVFQPGNDLLASQQKKRKCE